MKYNENFAPVRDETPCIEEDREYWLIVWLDNKGQTVFEIETGIYITAKCKAEGSCNSNGWQIQTIRKLSSFEVEELEMRIL